MGVKIQKDPITGKVKLVSDQPKAGNVAPVYRHESIPSDQTSRMFEMMLGEFPCCAASRLIPCIGGVT